LDLKYEEPEEAKTKEGLAFFCKVTKGLSLSK